MERSPGSADSLFLSFQLALAGRYSIDHELGRGGMGIVYLAREVHLDRLVAIKLLPPDRARDPSLRERFLREARLAAKLSHPNIIPIHAVDEVDGFVFYVMAYVDGETLAHRVRARGPLPASEGTRMLREVAWALAHAHGQGLVHRDVKPENILIESGTGRALVADFGIAAAVGDMRGDGVTGTPEFMSPEQALAQEVDARSDLYALGATAFFAFAGRVPFDGDSPTAVLAKHVAAPPPSLASLGLPVPRKVATLVDRCLAKEPHQRPASAEALADQLGVSLEQRREPPAALRAFVKRHGRVAGGGTILYTSLLLVGSTWISTFTGPVTGFLTLGLGMTVAPLGYLVNQARRLLRMGFAHGDLEPAFKGEIERAREEYAVERAPGIAMLERVLKVTAATSGSAFGLSIGAAVALTLFPGSYALEAVVRTVFVVTGPLSSISTLGYLSLVQRRTDIDTEFWARVWLGRIGKLIFATARKLVGRRVPSAAMTHRATELSLGLAAEQLFESLPKGMRRSLGDVPAVLRRLQEDAHGLRTRYDELQEAIAAAGDAGASGAYAEIRATRDAVHARLGDAVAALETIRLNLLRLHAGSGTVEGFTTHLGLAVEVSADVERLLSAREELERELASPNERTDTAS
jgi:tRNA A-37 threonylcarbamoyl transferase component Bud32